MLKEGFETLLAETVRVLQEQYGDRLVSVAVFGSVARGTQRADSDVDLLVVCDPLPTGGCGE